MSDKKTKSPMTTLAVGEESQDGGEVPAVGVKTIESGESAEDVGPAPQPAPADAGDEGHEDGGA